MFHIEDARLHQDGIDISDKMNAAELEAEGKVLLTYAKFKASVEKAAETCFGTPKKRAARKPKAKIEEVAVEQPQPQPQPAGIEEFELPIEYAYGQQQ